ncbi:MAG: hypothetical protein AAB554_04245 [Patescibacteria group bacterium]
MPDTVPLTSQEIDDGWCLDEAPPPDHDYESYELVVEEAAPASGFEEAYWEQVENRRLKSRFGQGTRGFGANSTS